MSQVPNIRLNNGVQIPQFGFGVFQIEPARTAEAVRTALEAGYRHIDTAQGYGNEEGVGQAVRESGLPRDEVFITTKLINSRHGYDEAIAALDESLQKLGLDYVDLYLIHWPRPHADRYVETWRAFEKILSDGKARSIGVSNFQVPHLQRLAAETGTVPAVNQIELHPWLIQRELREYHREHGIATEAWSPIGKGGDLLREERIVALAEKYGKTPAQVVLRWHIQHGNIVFPKSVTPSRIRENIDIFDFELSADDVAAIDGLDRGTRLGPDPDTFG
ncbi:MAG TPA: aldo/keto reductase [Pseudonocardia sp.]|jgi:2,5-diketo-D-gluconate reductase A|uniref:aldo/keto reductase n=1 Tax=Pseudonocardia sp. TaxID=60912 RepID=UPI002B4B82D6|nr:aldo/keto reductase [Pseudonocardia sp.]HLU56365.1 aldo/keto reductase [Pseudonocardia sp.]